MSAEIFAETSFLFSLYCEQEHSAEATAFAETLISDIPISALVKFEFENGLNFQAGRFRRDRNQGIAPRQKAAAGQAFQDDLEAGFWRVGPVDFPEILILAEDLSERLTEENLNRAMDVLHVATALHWGAKTFLSFDARQAKLAKAAGMKAPLKLS